MVNYSLILTEKIPYPHKGDTNLLIKESILRGYETYAFRPTEMFFENGELYCNAHKVLITDNGELAEEESTKRIDIAGNNIVNIRLNPPFDSKYMSAMYMLNYASKGSLIVNNAISIVKYPEKFIPAELTKFMPETLICNNFEKIKEFRKEHKDIIIKPLYEFSGRGVFRVNEDTENFHTIFQMMQEKYDEPIITQKYIPEIKQGDKRIVLLDGEEFGAFNRVPPEGQLQAALGMGGTLAPHTLTTRERDICELLKPILKKEGILLCGLDVIGDYLTEINITCPAGFYGINELYNVNSEKIFWEKLEEKING